MTQSSAVLITNLSISVQYQMYLILIYTCTGSSGVPVPPAAEGGELSQGPRLAEEISLPSPLLLSGI